MCMEKDFKDFEGKWDESNSVAPAMSALESSFGTAKLDEISEGHERAHAVIKMANAVALEMLREYHEWLSS